MITKKAQEGSILKSFLPFLDDAALVALKATGSGSKKQEPKVNKPVQTSMKKKKGDFDFLDLRKFAKLKIRDKGSFIRSKLREM